MDSNHKGYDPVASFSRIDSYFAAASGNYEEVSELPDRDRPTYSNGFYAMCSAVFIDIRDSSKLPQKYKRPALAKLYRAFISEAVAILNSHEKEREINIVGDCVWAVFNTPYKADIGRVFDKIVQLRSMVKVLDYKLKKPGYDDGISVGIGASYGRALMIKAGYNGSGLSDVVYMGDVVNHAAKLAAKGGTSGSYSKPIYLGNLFAENLLEDDAKFVEKDYANDCYTADAVNTLMNDWYQENCK